MAWDKGSISHSGSHWGSGKRARASPFLQWFSFQPILIFYFLLLIISIPSQWWLRRKKMWEIAHWILRACTRECPTPLLPFCVAIAHSRRQEVGSSQMSRKEGEQKTSVSTNSLVHPYRSWGKRLRKAHWARVQMVTHAALISIIISSECRNLSVLGPKIPGAFDPPSIFFLF